jgi:hypothetical protein
MPHTLSSESVPKQVHTGTTRQGAEAGAQKGMRHKGARDGWGAGVTVEAAEAHIQERQERHKG